MMKNYYLIMFLAAGMIISCGGNKKVKDEPVTENKNTYEKLKSLNWMIGSWNAAMGPGSFTETWSITNDSVYSGTGVGMEGKDTSWAESLSIVQRGEEVFYVTVLSDQNDGKPTEFKLTGSTSSTATFENKEHDFPTKIYYELKGDSLIATVSGIVDKKPTAEVFPLVRVK